MYPGHGSAKPVTRRAARARRAARHAGEAARVDAALAAAAPGLPVPAVGTATVAVYVSLPGEPGTDGLRERLAAAGHRVLLPWLLPDGDLDWVLDRPGRPADPMHPDGDRLGPDAVRGADVVLVPALAVDRAGTRLGQGGGSYDRALARLPAAGARAVVLAVVHDDEVLPAGALPVEAHDVRVDGVLTPTGLLPLPGAAPAAPGRTRPPPRA